MNPKQPVVVREVGLRDGLQSIARTLPTASKVQWLHDAYAAGLREIEVGSFVAARLLPQLAHTAALVDATRALPGLVTSVLLPNLEGAQAALDSRADLMLLPLSASRAHSLANLRKTPDEVVAEIGRIRALRDASGSACLLEVGMSTAFGCTLQGRVEEAEVLRLVQAVLDAGADRVGLADTVGYADPLAVSRLFDVAYLFASMGVATGLDFDALLALRACVARWLDGEALHGSIWRAGRPKTMLQEAA
jgi:hydroxymethylglutaryl-CoA lyase